MSRVSKLAASATLTAAVALALMALAAPAHAQKQEYDPWVYKEMVPTGPYMRNMEQAQPIPKAAPSHWGAIGKDNRFRAGMPRYGTDVGTTTRHYSTRNSLAPPPVEATRRPAAPPRSADPPPPPRAVQRP